jgi:hypothetical protein
MMEGSPRTNTLANTAHWLSQIRQVEVILDQDPDNFSFGDAG